MDTMTLTINQELGAIRVQTRRLAVWSFVAHAAAAVLFLAVATAPRPYQGNEEILTEITWLEPEVELAPVQVAARATEPEPEPQPAPIVIQQKPRPVMPARSSSVDLVQQLAAAPAIAPSRSIVAAATEPTAATATTAATLGTFAPSQARARQDLTRSGVRPAVQPVQLQKAQPSVLATATPPPVRRQPEAAVAPAEEILPGISLAGEVSGRQLVTYATPEYPEWAKRDGVEVSVELFFTVLPSGQVKENVLVERTSGYDDFDRRAKTALAAWRFESLAAGTAGEQWGRIEFKYRLRDAG